MVSTKIFEAKAKNISSNWVYGYPFIKNGKYYILDKKDCIIEWEIDEDTICYHLGAFDKNGKPVYTHDIINDFGGGVLVPDPNDFGNYIKQGDTTRFGEVIIVDGTVRIRTKEIGYSFNISNAYQFSDMEVMFNAYDNY